MPMKNFSDPSWIEPAPFRLVEQTLIGYFTKHRADITEMQSKRQQNLFYCSLGRMGRHIMLRNVLPDYLQKYKRVVFKLRRKIREIIAAYDMQVFPSL